MMQKKRYRILLSVGAIFLAFFLVVLLSYSGNKSKGPVENLFDNITEYVQDFERRNILEQRKVKRSDKLKWFEIERRDSGLMNGSNKILLGAYDNRRQESFESIVDLEDSLSTTFPFIHMYSAWGSKMSQKFPGVQVKTILDMGSLPVITWEPWLIDFDPEIYPELRSSEVRDFGGLEDIGNGLFDKYIIEWAREAAEIKAPILLRLAHEMNDPYRYPWGPHNNKPDEFVSAWRHTVDLFRSNGATNVYWIWSPHPAYGYFENYYPGDEYVDFTGVGILNYGTVAPWSRWWSFDEIFGQHYEALAAFNKPIMITEFGCLAVGGKRDTWFFDALNQLPLRYPLIKSVLFFHYSKDNTLTQQELNWYFINDSLCRSKINLAIEGWSPIIEEKVE